MLLWPAMVCGSVPGKTQVSFIEVKKQGILNYHSKKYDEAVLYFKKAVSLQPDTECYHYLALIYDILKEPQQAQRYRQLAGESTASGNQTTPAGSGPARVSTPQIEILSPLAGSTVCSQYLTLRYRTSAPPETGLEVWVNNQMVERGQRVKTPAASTSIAGADGGGELQIVIPPHDTQVMLRATLPDGSKVQTSVSLRWCQEPLVTTAPENNEYKPKLYILGIGVSAYADSSLILNYPAKDATDFVGVLKQQRGLLYEDVVVRLLTDSAATHNNILDGFQWIKTQTTTKDVAMIFLAGHGVDEDDTYYYLPQDADTNNLLKTGISFSSIKTTINSMAGKKFLFVDTCHSGNVFGSSNRRGAPNPDINLVVQELRAAENGTVIFTASTGRQASLENSRWGNGAFTKALVEGLSGQADLRNKGKVTVSGLENYISERVKELTNGKQTPTTAKPVTVIDFPLSVRINK
ncbi:MAG TPA: caspase family protein [Acidobacteriota bacterium]|nr:caspase family protein [Acidobacteriota bacterium]